MIIAPSILSVDYNQYKDQVKYVNDNYSVIHFDVMDGHFVPNMANGTKMLKNLRKNTNLFLDVHLMTLDPNSITDYYYLNGCDSITFHYEALRSDIEIFELIKKIKNNYIKVGISIKPGTDVKRIEKFLPYVDLVLIMSVEPGFSNQAFIPESLDKIDYLNKYRAEHELKYLIEVDGGVNDQTGYMCKEKGADILVVGSYLFDNDMPTITEKLLNLCK